MIHCDARTPSAPAQLQRSAGIAASERLDVDDHVGKGRPYGRQQDVVSTAAGRAAAVDWFGHQDEDVSAGRQVLATPGEQIGQ